MELQSKTRDGRTRVEDHEIAGASLRLLVALLIAGVPGEPQDGIDPIVATALPDHVGCRFRPQACVGEVRDRHAADTGDLELAPEQLGVIGLQRGGRQAFANHFPPTAERGPGMDFLGREKRLHAWPDGQLAVPQDEP